MAYLMPLNFICSDRNRADVPAALVPLLAF